MSHRSMLRRDPPPGRHQRLDRWDWLCFAIACALCLILAGCGYAKHRDPVIYTFADDKITALSAGLHAKDAGGSVALITCCGSMKPLIQDGDRVVILPKPYSDELLGTVALYRPKWANGRRIAHRLVAGNAAEGYIASGDNNPRSEAGERVRADNYEGEIIAIYRTKP